MDRFQMSIYPAKDFAYYTDKMVNIVEARCCEDNVPPPGPKTVHEIVVPPDSIVLIKHVHFAASRRSAPTKNGKIYFEVIVTNTSNVETVFVSQSYNLPSVGDSAHLNLPVEFPLPAGWRIKWVIKDESNGGAVDYRAVIYGVVLKP